MSLLEQVEKLDALTGKGEMLQCLTDFYDENCTFTEAATGDSRPNRQAQHDHLSGFFATLKGFNSATLHSSAASGDVSFSEWTFDMTAGDGSRIVWNEILLRHWKDGKVVQEKFYNVSS